MFNVERWGRDMREAISARDAETLARLMSDNDRNGCFSYEDVCNEFGETDREEWAAGTIECAKSILEDLPNHTDTN